MGLRDLMRELAKSGEEIYSVVGKVKSIDDTKRTCVVEPINGDADLLDIRVQAEQQISTGIYIKPKVNSDVLVTFLSKNTGYVALCSEVDSIEIKIGTQTIKIDGTNGMDISGFLKVASATSDLKSAIGELIDAIGSLVLVTPAGAGSVNSSSVTQLMLIKGKFNTFLQ
jgi:hypothetical protein